MATVVNKSYENDDTSWQAVIDDITDFYEWETITTVSETETRFINADGNRIVLTRNSNGYAYIRTENSEGKYYTGMSFNNYMSDVKYVTTPSLKAIILVDTFVSSAVFLTTGTHQITGEQEEILVYYDGSDICLSDSSNRLANLGYGYGQNYSCSSNSQLLLSVPLYFWDSLFIADNLYYITAYTLDTNLNPTGVNINSTDYYMCNKILMLDE